MTDDEAFVRRIVDSPGDDTPRLVYADWLDEQGDPRGEFLRAEAVWAGGDERWAVPTLRELAAPLDPVWVARVSRPPVGVCGERVQLADCGPSLSADQLDAAEQKLGMTLPTAFRALLLNANGGRPAPAFYPLADGDPGDTVCVLGFAKIDRPANDFSRHNLLHDTLYFRRTLELPPGWLLFAAVDGGEEDLVVSARAADAGAVYYWSHFEGGFQDPRPLAASIPEFLAGLIPSPYGGE